MLAFLIPSVLRFPVSPLFPSGIAELVFVVLYFLWLYFEITNQVFAYFKNKNLKIKIKNDKLSFSGIYVGFILGTYLVGLLSNSTIGLAIPAWGGFYAGIVVLLLGISMRFWSEYALGRFFTYPVLIMGGHKLIRKGPYKYIRHPSYLGGLLIMLSFALISRTILGVLVSETIMLLAYAYRIRVEEIALKKYFGKQYDNYAKATKRLIPYII